MLYCHNKGYLRNQLCSIKILLDGIAEVAAAAACHQLLVTHSLQCGAATAAHAHCREDSMSSHFQ